MHIGEKFYSDQDLKNFGFKSIGNNVKIKKNVGIFFTENVYFCFLFTLSFCDVVFIIIGGFRFFFITYGI